MKERTGEKINNGREGERVRQEPRKGGREGKIMDRRMER